MKEILDFYLRLSQNNNKHWFDEHRPEYEATKKKLHAIADEFIKGIEEFDPRCKGLQVKDCTYRINRDIRFSQDKRPYSITHTTQIKNDQYIIRQATMADWKSALAALGATEERWNVPSVTVSSQTMCVVNMDIHYFSFANISSNSF